MPPAENEVPQREAPPRAPEPELPAWAKRRASNGQIPDGVMAVFIGRKWEHTYKRKFAPFIEDPSFVPTWNWSAALTPCWFLYRKLYLTFAIFFIVPGFAFRWLTNSETVLSAQSMLLPENRPLVLMYFAVYLSSHIAAGGTANWFLFRRAQAATRLVTLQQLPDGEAMGLLQRIGGVNRSGTLLFLALSLVLTVAQLSA